MSDISESIVLLEHFDEFRKLYPSGSLLDFSVWLNEQLDSKKADTQDFLADMPFAFPATDITEYIGWIWGRLLKFTAVWEKKAFEDLTLNSIDEFGLLMYIQTQGSLSKSKIAEVSLMEKTTCFEMLKRLVQRGLIVEKVNSIDKREKLLSLSPLGQKELFGCFQRVKEVSDWLVKRLSEAEKVQLLTLLIKLDKFHENELSKKKDQSWSNLNF